MVHRSRASGTQFDYESGALPGRFIDQRVAGLGDGIGVDRVTFVTRFTPFQTLGKVQDPLAGDSSNDAPGHRRRTYAERAKTKIGAARASLKGDQLDTALLKIESASAPSRQRPRLRQCPSGRLQTPDLQSLGHKGLVVTTGFCGWGAWPLAGQVPEAM